MMTIGIGIPTAGRKSVVGDTLRVLKSLMPKADATYLCPASKDDVPAGCALDSELSIIYGSVGSSAQRNTLIRNAEVDVLVFFDDDFIPSVDYIKNTLQVFEDHPDVVMVTGTVLADGVVGPGLEFNDAIATLRKSIAPDNEVILDVYNGYGCNMAIRMSVVRKQQVFFDEKLPLYGWLEDVDFSRQLSKFGRIVKSENLRGVHLGTKVSGRSPGRQLGYSQVANPVYLARKGTLTKARAGTQIIRNIIANSVRSLRPEPWVDRRGRLVGNCIAIRDLIFNRVTPMSAMKYS